jgi:HlyD family secretion protein
MENQRIDYLSEDVQEIMSTPPGWIATWGSAAIIIALFIMFIVGWQFKYPDKLNGKLTLTTPEQPVAVYAHKAEYLSEILVQDGDVVEEGQMLAIFKNFADLEDVLTLEQDVKSLSTFDVDSFENFNPNTDLVLGDIFQDYSNFLTTLEDFSFSNESKFDNKGVDAIYKQIRKKDKIIKGLQSQEETIIRQIELANRQFKSYTKDYEKSIEKKDFNKMMSAKKTEEEKRSELGKLNIQIAKENDGITQLRASISDKKFDSKNDSNARLLVLKQRLSNLQAAISEWKKNYLITSPITGEVSFFNSKTEQQFYNKGDEVMAIVPPQAEGQYIGYINLPIHGSGKVEQGQEVLIKFERFPFREFGHVKGIVSDIALLPKNDAYEVEVQLEDGLVTNFGKELKFRQMMLADADIITGNERFVTRIFRDLFSFFG